MINERSKKSIPVYLVFSLVMAYFIYKNTNQLNDFILFMNITLTPIQYALIGVSIIWLMWIESAFRIISSRPGEEQGSARWATPSEIKKLFNRTYEKNMLFSQNARMDLNTRKTRKNNNILIVGSSGSGKTRFFLKPNLMQCHSSYVVTDPKGELLPECGKMLRKNGYKIRYWNSINFKQSMHYNPFVYIKSEKDILTLVNTIILNTKGEGDKSSEDFWVKAERLLYNSLIAYIFYECKESEKNITTLIFLLDSIEVKENDENHVSPIDIIFSELESKQPSHFAVSQYNKFKKAAGKTAKSILISCGARLAPFDIEELQEITSYDELSLDTIGDEKTAIFIMPSDTDSTFDFIIGMIFTQMFNILCDRAIDKYKGKLPVHVRVLADEIINICQIPKLEKITAVIRSREISLCPIVQNIGQIKSLYKENASTIIGNCNSLLFLGSDEHETTKSMSERVGKTTINYNTTSQSKGINGSSTVAQQTIARDLITPDEVAVLDDDECIVFVKGKRPLKDKKFNIEKHKNYKELADYDNNNYYAYWQDENKIVKPQEFFKNVKAFYEVDASILNAL